MNAFSMNKTFSMNRAVKTVVIAILCLAGGCMSLGAQVIKIENGVSLASMTRNENNFFTRVAAGYTGRVGIDWLEHRWFYLSSEVGYMATGGMDLVDVFTDSGLLEDKMKWHLRRDNLHINTTIRFRLAYSDFHAYVGVGPKVDIPSGCTLEGNLFDKSVMLGIKAEVGCAYDFSCIRLGLNVAYLPDLTRQAIPVLQQARNNIFSVGVSVGYIL